MTRYWQLFEELSGLPRHINSPGFDYSLEKLSEEYDLEVVRFTAGDEHNGWVIPPKYRVEKASITLDGKELYDGSAHPLGVISHSAPFSGRVTKSQLLEHIHTDNRNPDWIPYHFSQTYRPWARDWGFCMPQKTAESFPEGEYDVMIDIDEGVPELGIARGVLKGTSGLTLVLCAHLDHPGMANDGLSGVMVACEVLKRLRGQNLVYGVEILIVPEIIGTETYLHNLAGPVPFEGLFIESVGRKGSFILQSSQTNSYLVEDKLGSVLRANGNQSRKASYKEIFGNDEGCFEAYGCPMPALHRGYFEGYHSSADDFASIDLDATEEAIEVVLKLTKDIQKEVVIRKKYDGVIATSNPRFDLYIDHGQVAFGGSLSIPSLRRVMETMALPKKTVSLNEICLRAQSDQSTTYRYLKQWERSGLIEILGDHPEE